MSRYHILLFILLGVVASCSPSPRYTIGPKSRAPQQEKTESAQEQKSSEKRKTSPNVTPSKIKPGMVFEGVASYYADDFHNKKTANGETYNMHGLTCAHKTLPFNTWLEVTNLANNRKVIVRVNDRGPYVGKRIIDLSLSAAKELDMIQSGIQKVSIEVISVP